MGKAKELADQQAYQALIVGSSLLSTGLLLVGIIVMPLEMSKKLFLITGAAFVLSTAFFLAKNVRDRLEAKRLSSPIASSIGHADPGEALKGSGSETTGSRPI